MNELITAIRINNRVVELPIKADKFAPGKKEVLFDVDDSPAKHTNWIRSGYTIQPFLTKEQNTTIRNGIEQIIIDILNNINVDTTGFELHNYHKFVDDKTHLQFAEAIRAGSDGTGGIPMHKFPVPIEEVDKRIGEICNTKVTARKVFNLENNQIYTVKHFWIRVVRPQHYKDNNPPHRDVHLDRSRGAVNIYFPLAGSNENSSLPIIPESHHWPESEIVRTYGNAYVNDVKYTNPATVSAVKGLNLITPNPSLDEVMVFTPYTIHGGGYNFNSDITRVSLEMRFWKI
jgi:hypothetical protein